MHGGDGSVERRTGQFTLATQDGLDDAIGYRIGVGTIGHPRRDAGKGARPSSCAEGGCRERGLALARFLAGGWGGCPRCRRQRTNPKVSKCRSEYPPRSCRHLRVSLFGERGAMPSVVLGTRRGRGEDSVQQPAQHALPKLRWGDPGEGTILSGMRSPHHEVCARRANQE